MERNYRAALLVGLTVLAVSLVGAMAVSGAVGADSPDESSQNEQITVDAIGEAEAQPDMAVVDAAIRVTGDDPQEIREEVASGASELETALDEANVEYKTTSYRIGEERRPSEGEEPQQVGIHAFEITVDDPDDVGDIVELAANAGAEIGNVRMTLSDEKRTEVRDDAIENAMDDARMQADTIASTSDLVVTGVVDVDASERSFRPVEYESDSGGDGAADAPPTNIDMGDVSVVYTVDVTYNATSS